MSLSFPLSVSCELDTNTRIRRVTHKDAVDLFVALAGDKEGWEWFLEDLEIPQAPATLRSMRRLVKKLVHHEEKIAYVVETRVGNSYKVIGLTYFNTEDAETEEEIETSFIYSKWARGLGYHEATTHCWLKMILEMGYKSTRWVDVRNDSSNASSAAMGTLDRTEEWEGHLYNIYVVREEDWPEIEVSIKSRFERKVVRRTVA
jgi:RimJ/RimL family protein N-acetyltransferase